MNLSLIDETTHPMDRDPALVDPALVDLQTPHDDYVMIQDMHDREKRDRRRETMQGQLDGIRRVPTTPPSSEVMEVSNAEKELSMIGRGEITNPPTDVCMVTGNRKLYDPDTIREEIHHSIDGDRPDIMISGMALGTDTIFAEIALEEGIPLHAYIPFTGQADRWSTAQQARYQNILVRCDKVVVITDHPSRKAYLDRNIAMIQASTRGIVVHDGKESGGTAYTLRRLKRGSTPYQMIENTKWTKTHVVQ